MMISPPQRFFVSFSSRDLKHVREIMAALKGQELDFWDYSDIIQSIEIGDNINERLIREIDTCTHMIVVISKNSSDLQIGRFCRMELEYARRRNAQMEIELIPVILDPLNPFEWQPPYTCFKANFCYDLDNSPESIVRLTVKICQLIEKVYIPPIEAHPRMPFWKLFRKEVEDLAHSNKEHVDLMMIIGEFNEYYRKTKMQRTLFLINYFIDTCNYRVYNYKPFYPLIVKAVCETELEMYDEAMKSYEKARLINPENQDVIGGIGTVYFKTGHYQEAANCFEQIISNNKTEDLSNARINLIITKQAMEIVISDEEEEFLFNLNIDPYPDDLKTAILNSQALQFKINEDHIGLEKHCRKMISQNLHDTISIRLLQLSFLNRGMTDEAEQVIIKALEESKSNPGLDGNILRSFLT